MARIGMPDKKAGSIAAPSNAVSSARTLRSSLRRMAPHSLLGLVRDFHEFENTRTYGSWAEAEAAARTDYEDDLLARFRIARARENADIMFRCEMLHLCAGMLGPRIEITDFGGATGYYGETLCRELPDIKYTVVETPTMVKLAQSLTPRLTFQSTIPEGCDIFFTSCTLPYLDDPMGVLEKGLKSARKIAIVSRNCFCEREIFRVQTSELFSNGAGKIPAGFTNTKVRYAHRTTVPEEVIRLADSQGFRLAARVREAHDDSGSLAYRYQTYSGTMVFIRR